MKRNIPDHIKEAYLNWLLTPPGDREPTSKKQFAEIHDIALKTLYNWEDEEAFQIAIRSIKTKWGAKYHGEIVGRLMEIVLNGSDTAAVSASKLLLSHLHIPDDAIESKDISEEAKTALRQALAELGYKNIGE